MAKSGRIRVVSVIVILLVALAGFLLIANSVFAAGQRTQGFGASVFLYAIEHERMPASFEELLAAGYARPADDTAGRYFFLDRPNGDPATPAIEVGRYDVSWGVSPEQMVQRDKGVFWRDRPDERVLLIRDRQPPLAVRLLGGRMAMAFPAELYRTIGGQEVQATASTTQPRPRE